MSTFNDQQRKLFNTFGIAPKWLDKSFDDLRDSDEKKKIIAYLTEVEKGNPPPYGYFIYGGNGLGKTMAANLSLIKLRYMGKSVRFVNFNVLVTEYVKNWDKNADESYFNSLLNCKYLVIDEVGKEYASKKGDNESFVNTCFDYVIKYRIQHNKITWVVSNLHFSLIKEKYTQDIFSMMCEAMVFLPFGGVDFRKEIQNENKQTINNTSYYPKSEKYID